MTAQEIPYRRVENQGDIERLTHYDVVRADSNENEYVVIWGIGENKDLLLGSKNTEGKPVVARCSKQNISPSASNPGNVVLGKSVEFRIIEDSSLVIYSIDDILREAKI